MKFLSSIFLSLVSISAYSDPVELKVDYQVFSQEMKNGKTKGWVPEFEIYNSSGEQVLRRISLSDKFKLILEKTMENPKSNGKVISGLVDKFKLINSEKRYTIDYKSYDFVFIEYWAEWCSNCKTQMKIVKEYIEKSQGKNILWVKVERDPNKLKALNRKPS